jgi:hypothetical protein
MKKLRPQVSADLVEQVKGERKSFENGLRDLVFTSDVNKLFLKQKNKDWDKLREKYNREVHKRETLELKCKQLEHNAKVKDVAEFSDAIAVLLGLDKETLGKSTSITIKVELGEIFLSAEGYIPLEKLTN